QNVVQVRPSAPSELVEPDGELPGEAVLASLPKSRFHLDPPQVSSPVVNDKDVVPDVHFRHGDVVGAEQELRHDRQLSRLPDVRAPAHRVPPCTRASRQARMSSTTLPYTSVSR